MSDVVWQAIIAGVVTIVLAWMQRRTQQSVEAVKVGQDVTHDKLQENTDLTAQAKKDASEKLDQIRNENHKAAEAAAEKAAATALKTVENLGQIVEALKPGDKGSKPC